jgi:hypothetical protein
MMYLHYFLSKMISVKELNVSDIVYATLVSVNSWTMETIYPSL